MNSYRSLKRGFTLVEILIVVIILGILAAIVIPQFTNASTEARLSSTRSQVQSIRSQVELYKLQHVDRYPTDNNTAAGNWVSGGVAFGKLVNKTDEDGTLNATGAFGPYLQAPPANALRSGATTVVSVADDAAALGTTAAAGQGYVFSQATGKLWAFDEAGAVITD
ncbi:MAG TPA: prepilin-type N-terminal cleavage/methylation domain-containing protein [Tepidisphaeraceae bacterium]|nr:prepilin-type N-terminal cleavage/methylation domain-containing protein [Tepidisphaeraceae bacterium]